MSLEGQTVKLTRRGVFLDERGDTLPQGDVGEGRKRTIAYRIMQKHNVSSSMERLNLRFDAMVSPDNNYVSILQAARASGLTEFPVPYVLTNCHNALCAVGGTIAEDDHAYGLSCVKRYGGIFVPPYRAVLHQYMRETMAGCGKMILGSDSHTRYGALGTMGIGEGGGELVKQLLHQTYDIPYPPVLAVKLTGSPRPGIGPMDAALAVIARTFANGFNKDKVLEFLGDGVGNLSVEFRMGLDVMMTESAALSSVWRTDERTREYLRAHGREEDYHELFPLKGAYYDGMIELDLGTVESMIALPFHPSRAMTIREFKEAMVDVLLQVQEEGQKIKGERGRPFSIMHHIRDGGFYPDQALVSGCAGGLFENIAAMADILRGHGISGEGMSLHVNPASLPVMEELIKSGVASELAVLGVTIRPAICGPCFGVTDVPADQGISIRHVTRNYPTREGSKPGQGQMAAVCLMDARSIAATARNGGRLTAADEIDVSYRDLRAGFNPEIYRRQVFNNLGRGNPQEKLIMGPNIADWPSVPHLKRNLLLKAAGVYHGSVTTDELIPSGEASSYRSNPEKLAGYTMMSRDSEYVARARAIRDEAVEINEGPGDVSFGSLIASEQVGDGSSREQAASCQRVLGGFANLANEYSTKRYRSNCVNWGLLPLRTEERIDLQVGAWLYIEDLVGVLDSEASGVRLVVLDITKEMPSREIVARLQKEGAGALRIRTICCTLDRLTGVERETLKAGCLINYYKSSRSR